MKDFLARFMPMDASAHGPQLDSLNALVHWLMLILFVCWGAYFIYVLRRFRASNSPKASYTGVTSHFSTYSEAGVALVELVLLVAFSIPAWYSWSRVPPTGDNPLVIRVVGEQFAWNVHYPGPDGIFGRTDIKLVSADNPLGIDRTDPHAKDDITSLNQLHLQINRPVIINLTSKDVIHSFFLPVMRVKQDAIPGLVIPIHFTPVKTNSGSNWEIACAQLCGLGHYRMRGQLVVESKAELDKFFVENAPIPDDAVAPEVGSAPAPAAAPTGTDAPTSTASPTTTAAPAATTPAATTTTG